MLLSAMWQCYHKFCMFVLFIFLVLLWAYVSGHLALCVLCGLFSLNCELSDQRLRATLDRSTSKRGITSN